MLQIIDFSMITSNADVISLICEKHKNKDVVCESGCSNKIQKLTADRTFDDSLFQWLLVYLQNETVFFFAFIIRPHMLYAWLVNHRTRFVKTQRKAVFWGQKSTLYGSKISVHDEVPTLNRTKKDSMCLHWS